MREAEARAEAERKARKKAEAEAREARWKARAEELAAQRAQEARGRAAGWTWFLALVLVVGGLAAYGWWQQEQERSQAQVQLFQQEVEVSRRAQQEAERKAEEARQKLAEAPVKGEPGEGGKGDARLMGEGNALVEAARLEGSPLQGRRAGDRTTVRVGVREVALRWCPAGTFTMGSPEREEGRGDDETQHRVTLTRGFWMGETEVTQGLWGEVMGKNPLVFKSGDNYPMESVSWEDCQKFVQALNSRYPQEGLRWALPTEAQWEYACRAGRGTAYSWGNALNGDKANCNGKYPCGTTVKGPYKKKTTPVGSYDPNAWGLYDMHGNVWEWCVDWYDSGYYAKTPRANPKGPISGADRVLRGGGFWNDPRGCRAAIRGGGHLGDRSRGRGFRPVARQD